MSGVFNASVSIKSTSVASVPTKVNSKFYDTGNLGS